MIYLWLVTLTPLYTDRIISFLVRQGYSVKPMATNKQLELRGNVSCVVALQLSNVTDQAHIVVNKLKDHFDKEKMFYYGIVATAYNEGDSNLNMSWNGSNIELPPPVLPKTVFEHVQEEDAKPKKGLFDRLKEF